MSPTAARCALVVALSLAAVAQADSVIKFQPGQVWTFSYNGHESQARIIIGKTETLYDLGPAVHISVIGVPVFDPNTNTLRYAHIWHLALSQRALDASVMSIEQTVKVPEEFQARYKDWRDSYLKNQDGLIDRPLAAALKRILPNITEVTVGSPGSP